jgi:predicted Zn-dependent protease
VTWQTAKGGDALLNRFYTGFKDEYEFEADRLGMDYAANAGYDRAALVQFMDRLAGKSPEIGPREMTPLHSTKKSLGERMSKAKGTPADQGKQ